MATSEDEVSKSLVIINYLSGKYFVWNADDAFILRTKHRVCGQLVGSKPRKTWQPYVHSVPLILVPAEAHFCYKNGIAKIVVGKDYFSKRIVTPSSILDFNNKRSDIESDQIRAFKTGKEEKGKLYFGYGTKLSRRAKRHLREMETDSQDESETLDPNSEDNKIESEAFNSKSAKVKCGIDTSDSDLVSLSNSDPEFNAVNKTSEYKQLPSMEDLAPQVDSKDEDNLISSADDDSSNIDIQWEDTALTAEDFKYYNRSLRVHIPTDTTSTENFFDMFLSNYPMTEKEKCSCAVYEDIHKRGFFVTSALKFGGDFLVYLGDPLRHHSHYIILILERNEVISTKEMVTYGRLAAAVKKTVVLATLNNDFSTIDYLSVTWAQMK